MKKFLKIFLGICIIFNFCSIAIASTIADNEYRNSYNYEIQIESPEPQIDTTINIPKKDGNFLSGIGNFLIVILVWSLFLSFGFLKW